MRNRTAPSSRSRVAALAIALSAAATLSGGAFAADVSVVLSGEQEVPPVTTTAKGMGTISIGSDKRVSGSITTTGVTATAAHIHEGAPGKNGDVIVPLEKSGDKWVVPANATLTDAQHKAFMAGNLYVNVHSAAHKDGEIRGQLKP